MSWAVRSRWLLSGLLVAAAALFVIGVASERGDEGHEEATETAQVAQREAAEHAEGAGHDESAEATAAASSNGARRHDESGETLLGVDVESTPLVVAAVVVSLGLALAVWLRRDRWLLWVTAGFAAVFALFDVAEIVRQINERRAAIAVVAIVVALFHAGAAALAESGATRRQAAG